MIDLTQEIEPTRNAVIVEFLDAGKKIVHIECVDTDKQAEMREYALRLLREDIPQDVDYFVTPSTDSMEITGNLEYIGPAIDWEPPK